MERFEKVKALGRGAQGSVILVRRKSDGSRFVIKRIFMDEIQAPEEQVNVMNEIKVLSSLAHPNIIGYYGSFVQDGVLNVVMEYADSGCLHQMIQKCRQPLSEAQLVSLFAQLLLAVRHIHKKKILHRDLKTRNVFLTRAGCLKIGDFGLSKVLGSAASFAQSAVGTPYYLSPELCEGRPYNSKSDVWALGCIVYEMATFKHAFDATNLPALVVNIVQGEYAPVPAAYSGELRAAIQACLVKDPDQRPGVDQLLALPLLQAEAARLEGEARGAIEEHINRPFFFSGQVETALTQAVGGGAHGGGVGGSGRVSTGALLSEMEEEEEFHRLISRFRGALDIRDRTQNGVPFFKSFTGADFAEFLVRELSIPSREEAAAIAGRWLDAGVFYHVGRHGRFRADGGLYRFKEDEVGSILNMKSLWQGPVRSPEEILGGFYRALGGVYARFVAQGSEGATSVDYEGLAVSAEFQALQASSSELQKLDLTALSFSEKVAFFLNIFNALVLVAFVVVGPPTTHHQRLHFFNHTCFMIGNHLWSLDEVRDGVLRGNQKPHMSYQRVFRRNDPRLESAVVVWDPRIHFALVRGSRSCPPYRLYTGDNVDLELNNATAEFCSQHIRVSSTGLPDPAKPFAGLKRQIVLPALFEWYTEDFGSTGDQCVKWAAQFLPKARQREVMEAIESDNYDIRYTPFDWTLNKRVGLSGAGGQPGSPAARPPPPDRPASLRPSRK